jgi:IAA-amino acid hydrolase
MKSCSFHCPLLLLLLLFVAQINSVIEALPFGKPKGNASGNNDDEAAEVQVRVRGAAAVVTQQLRQAEQDAAIDASYSSDVTSLNSVVEAWFATENENDESSSKALRDALRHAANTTAMLVFMQTVRRSLHRHPELMYELPFTSNVIQTTLDELKIPYTTGWAKNTHPEAYTGPGGYGIVAHIGSMQPDQPCIILRADMDALPILEATPYVEAFKSRQTGKMHACGHDGHVTMLLGAAALLKNIEPLFPGTIRLVFQPAEEGGAGMKRMVEEGVVDKVVARSSSSQSTTSTITAQWAFGLHVWPTLPTGVVASKPGVLMAATEVFDIVLQGKGGHAAMPHLTIDPIVAASSFVLNVQTLVSRNLSPLEAGVVSVTHISTPGDAFNVIPATTKIRGTIRSLGTESLLDLRSKVDHMIQSTAAMYGCNYTISFSPDYYPPTVNDPILYNEFSRHVGAIVSREEKVREAVPTMGGEDFAFLAQRIPSTFFFIGQGTGGDNNQEHQVHMPRTDYGLHHPSFALDENVLPIGVEMHANLAIRALKALSENSSATLAQAEEL